MRESLQIANKKKKKNQLLLNQNLKQQNIKKHVQELFLAGLLVK